MRHTIGFLLNGAPQTIEGADPTATVLNHLRYALRQTGTKEGCAEGDCGACTVVIGELVAGAVRYRAVNACILFLPMIDGRSVWTVEGLRGADGGLHPVQQALVDHHGSQCGFCTPGFVMALYAHYLNGGATDTATLDDVLAGNLCRCTGYGPIRTAGRTMGDYAAPPPPDETAALTALQDRRMLVVDHGERRFFAPRTADDLAEVYAYHADATLLAGATDVGLWVTKQHRQLKTVISIGDVAGFDHIEETPDGLRIGAGARFSDVIARFADLHPDLGELVRRFASVQIRNSATVGGNIANGSPIGDSMPALIALGAELVLRRGDDRRTLALEDFFLDYGKQDRQPGEFVEAVLLPTPPPDLLFRAYKISKRFDQDISAVCACFGVRREGARVTAARLCFGGMAGTPKRAARAEAALVDQGWTDDGIRAAMAALAEDFTPMTDMRGSADYRLRSAQNLLFKAFLESGATAPVTRVLDLREAAHG